MMICHNNEVNFGMNIKSYTLSVVPLIYQCERYNKHLTVAELA